MINQLHDVVPNAPTPATPERALSVRTRAAYAGDWVLLTDWCAATGRVALPADTATVDAFRNGCPTADSTHRRRGVAIEHYHRAAGYSVRAPRRLVPQRTLIDPEQVQLAMLMLPSHGWTAGLFGRRDRALLALASMTLVSYRQMVAMTIGQVQVVDGVAVVTDTFGRTAEIEAAEDPVSCGPCALARWRRVVDVVVRPDQHAVLPDLLGKANPVTAASRHYCHEPDPINPVSAAAALLPPINQWGHFPHPVRAMTRDAAALLSRQAETGLPGHRILPSAHLVGATTADAAATVASRPAPVWDWVAANQAKKEAVIQLRALQDREDDIDARADALLARSLAVTELALNTVRTP